MVTPGLPVGSPLRIRYGHARNIQYNRTASFRMTATFAMPEPCRVSVDRKSF